MNDNTYTLSPLAAARRVCARLPAAGLLSLLCVALVAPSAHAEPDTFGLGTGRSGALNVNAETTVNVYAQVTEAVPAGQSFVTVGDTAGFGAGDLVLVLQSTGLAPSPQSGNQEPINLANAAVGRWEFARVAANGVSENQLTFTAPLTVGFAANATQVVQVPEYTTVTVNAGGSIVAPRWNGAVGGVVIFLAQGAVSNAGAISASGRGFRGGIFINGQGDGCTGFDAPFGTLDDFIGAGAPKGEGVVPSRYSPEFPPVDGTTGYGNIANGAGGGICHNSGGGGGGSAGAGGKGGRTWSGEDGASQSRDVGGLGGTRMDFDPLNHVLFGGGGGAGHGNDNSAGAGSAGGGIVFIRGASLSGSGTISADGFAGVDAQGLGNDAAGGGGAGGTLSLRFTGAFNCDGGLRLSARGGNGGSTNFPEHGTGGGGGGGRVHVQGVGITPNCAPDVSGGAAGTQPLAEAIDGLTYGALAGSPGFVSGMPTSADAVDIIGPANDAVLTNPVVTYTGTAEPGATVTVVVDGQPVGTVTAAADGSWSFASPSTLADGPHSVTATAVDPQGNTTTDTHTFRVDTGTSVAITNPADGAVLTNGVVTYTGTAEPGATVTVVVDGQTVGTVTAAVDGTWSVAAVATLADGPHTVTATAVDPQGNTATDTHTFTVDTATSVAITNPTDGAVLGNPVVTYTGTAEPGATVTVVVDGQQVGMVVAADGTWSVESNATLGEGPHTVTATATDAQGHTATDTHTFTVDTQTAVDITGPASGAVLTNGVVTYTGTAEPGATVTVVVDGVTVGTVTAAADGTWSITAATRLVNGPHTVTATAVDPQGNTATDTHTFTVDSATVTDTDGDGLDDATEIERGLDPNDPDTDDDGVIDGVDGITDTDGDGTIDARDPDSDNDGLLDGTELGVMLENAPVGTNTGSPNFVPDSDPSTTTDPKRADTDGDGLNDGREDANRNGGFDNGETDPVNRDTDLGGASDGEEVNGGSNPLDGNDDFVVVGRGCSTGGAGTFAPLAMLLLALPLLGRLRRSGGRPARALVAGAAGGLVLTGALVASPAEAQVTAPPASQAIDVQQYKPGPGAGDILGVHSARVQRHLGWNVGLSLNYADKPLNFLDPRQDRFITALVRSQVGLDLMGAVGLFDRFELGVVLPVTVQDSEPAPQVDASFSNGVGSGGIGDLRVVPKARLVDGESFDLALAVPMVLPTGGGSDFLGGSGFGVQPRLVAEYGQRLRIAANLGLDLRKQQQLRNLNTGNAFTYGVGAELPFTVGELPLAAAATVVGALGLEEQDTEERPLELLAALKYRSLGGFAAHVGAGPGLTRGYGTPGFRVLAGLSYSPEPSREPKPVVAPAPVDSDGDGLMDPEDRCPVEAEDKDGHEDADGCPDPDNDSDGILDGSDKCISEPETKNSHEDADGCPDTEPAPVDSDGDGLVDPKDGCPSQAEDQDGFEDEDGCPDLDNDKDGIADTADKCPAEPEVINGVQDEDGCPDKGKVKVQVDGERILILEKVYFATSKDVILARSFPLLKQVAAVLRANPQVELLRIEGHTDDQGNDAKNLDLSRRRAANVRKFLVNEGILPVRLESAGYGETKPVDTNKTAQGRENNRRVEFTILRVSKVEVERDAP